MAYRDIATITVAIQGAGISAQGFGTPLFASSHRSFTERVRTYSSLTEVANDFDTGSSAYAAATGFFSNTPSPSFIKIGRREADLDITVAAGSAAASLDITATDGADTFSLEVSVTGQADEDAVASAIVAAIEGDSDIGPLVVASASTDTVTLDVANPDYAFTVSELSEELSESFNTTETAPDLIAAISQADDDYYFFTSEDHTETFVLAAAADIEAREKMYFFSTDQQSALTPLIQGSATDLLGVIKDYGYDRTKGKFSHIADTSYPECNYIGFNAPFSAGSVSWTNLQMSVPASQDLSTGYVLNSTQKGYLEDRNAAYMDKIGSLNVLRNGRVASGERIDTIRGRDNLVVDLYVAYTNLLISQNGSKIRYNNSGISRLEAVCRSVLESYVRRGFINSNYTTSFLTEDLVSTANKSAGLYEDGTFEAELSGAIDFVSISGILSINL